MESTLTDLDLAELLLAAQFVHDERGRIVSENEPDGDPEPAPRFFLVRTREGHAWRVRHDLPEGVVRRLEACVASEPVSADLVSPPVNLEAMRTALRDDQEPATGFQGPGYRFPGTVPALDPVTRVSRETLDLLRGVVGKLEALERDFDQVEPWMAVVEDGMAVATCYSCRLSVRAAQARVDTAPPFRGRGYAPALVAAWAEAVRATGRVPLYGTTWDNLASQAVARKLGLVPYAACLAIE